MTTFFQEPTLVTVRDVEVKVVPLAVKNLAKAAKCATPLVGAFKDGSLDPMVILENADVVIDLVAIATDKDANFIGELNAAEMLELLTAVVKVNGDFFSQKVMPNLTGLVKSVEAMNQTQTQ